MNESSLTIWFVPPRSERSTRDRARTFQSTESERRMFYDVLEADIHDQATRALFGERLIDDFNQLGTVPWIIVCFTNRCGSTRLCSYLSSFGLAGDPNEFRNYEFLNEDAIRAYVDANACNSFTNYLMRCEAAHAGKHAFTIKASPRQLNFLIESGVLARLSRPPAIVWVRRRNVIAQAISLQHAEVDRCWTSLHDAGPTHVTDIDFDAHECLCIARRIREDEGLFQFLFDAHGIRPETVWHEDVPRRPEDARRMLRDAVAPHVRRLFRRASPSRLPVEKQSASTKTEWETRLRSVLDIPMISIDR